VVGVVAAASLHATGTVVVIKIRLLRRRAVVVRGLLACNISSSNALSLLDLIAFINLLLLHKHLIAVHYLFVSELIEALLAGHG